MSDPSSAPSAIVKSAVDRQDVEPEEVAPGLWRQTLAHGPGLMLCLFTFRKGAVLPEHAHPHEQAGYVLSGELELIVGDAPLRLSAGMSYYVRGNERHSGTALADTQVLDAFSPARVDYILP